MKGKIREMEGRGREMEEWEGERGREKEKEKKEEGRRGGKWRGREGERGREISFHFQFHLYTLISFSFICMLILYRIFEMSQYIEEMLSNFFKKYLIICDVFTQVIFKKKADRSCREEA
jgi:hypothetical protein